MKNTFLLVAVACSLTASAQKVSNKLTFKKGQKFEMVSQVNSVISMDMMGQSLDSKIDVTITRLFDVANVAKGGLTTIEHKVKRMQMNFEVPQQGSQSFDSDNEADMKGEGGKMAEKAMKNKYTLTLDRTGKITDVKADDDNPNKTPDSTFQLDPMSGALAQIASGMELPKTGDMSDFKILPDFEVSKGQSWTDSTKDKKTVYTLGDVTDTDIIIDYTEDATLQKTQDAGGMEISMSSKDKTTGKIILDKNTGLLKERTATTNSEATMEMMGQSVPMNTKSTKKITVLSK
jgi:hypothetical protein